MIDVADNAVGKKQCLTNKVVGLKIIRALIYTLQGDRDKQNLEEKIQEVCEKD